MPIGKKKRIDTDVYTLAIERINIVYDQFDHVAVSFSGGKDSTTVLNLALQVARERKRLPLHVFHFDEEAIPFEVEHYIRRIIAAHPKEIELDWYCVPLKHRNACSKQYPYWYTWAPEDKDKWCRPLPPEAIASIPSYDTSDPKNRLGIPELMVYLFPPQKYGQTGVLLGIRSDESLTRYRAVAAGLNREYPWMLKHATAFAERIKTYGNLFKAYPIYDWTTNDVWTAPAKFGWDYCRYYDLLEMAGVSPSDQRLAPPYGEQPMKGLWIFPQCFPDLWDKMCRRVPGASSGARYGETALYSNGSRLSRPPDISWEDWIKERIEQYPEDMQRQLALRVKDEIRRHYNKTSLPILDSAPHPDTGLCWEWISYIVETADTKGRRKADNNVAPQDSAKSQSDLRRYEEALAAYRQGQAEEGTRF